jgi:dethiobiotin synthase
MQIVAIAGTGTAVGKTYVTAELRRGLEPRVHVVALKPIESGYERDASDALQIASAGRQIEPLYRLEHAVSPHLAARLAGVSIDITSVLPWVRANVTLQLGEPASADALVLIETAGGLLTPLTDDGTSNLDLIERLGPCRWLLVAPNRLGVIHDVRAALAAAPRRPPMAVVLAGTQSDASSASNAAELSRLLGPTLPVFEIRSGGRASPALLDLMTIAGPKGPA